MLKNLPTGGALHRGWGAEAAGSQGNSGLGSLFGFLCFSFSPSLKGRWETSNLQDPGRSTHCGLNDQNNVWKLDLTHETNSLFPAKYFLLSFCFRHHSLCQKESSVSRPRWSSPDTVWPWANHFCPLDLSFLVSKKKPTSQIRVHKVKWLGGSSLHLYLYLYLYLHLYCSLVAKCCPNFCDLMDYDPPRPSVHGILQARILEWAVISFSRGSSWPRDRTCIYYIGRQILYCWATREAYTHTHKHIHTHTHTHTQIYLFNEWADGNGAKLFTLPLDYNPGKI